MQHLCGLLPRGLHRARPPDRQPSASRPDPYPGRRVHRLLPLRQGMRGTDRECHPLLSVERNSGIHGGSARRVAHPLLTETTLRSRLSLFGILPPSAPMWRMRARIRSICYVRSGSASIPNATQEEAHATRPYESGAARRSRGRNRSAHRRRRCLHRGAGGGRRG